MATKKPKQTKLDFKAPKGKAIVHVFVAVDDNGNVEPLLLHSNSVVDNVSTFEEAAAHVHSELAFEAGDGTMQVNAAVYHFTAVLDKPIPRKVTKKSVKAKKVDVPAGPEDE